LSLRQAFGRFALRALGTCETKRNGRRKILRPRPRNIPFERQQGVPQRLLLQPEKPRLASKGNAKWLTPLVKAAVQFSLGPRLGEFRSGTPSRCAVLAFIAIY